jgi:DNA primase
VVLAQATSGQGAEDALFEAPEPVKRAIEVALRQLPEGGAALEQAFLTVCRKLMLRRIDEQLAYIEKATKQAPGAYDLTEETRRLLAQRIELLALKKRVQEELRPSVPGTKAPLQPV